MAKPWNIPGLHPDDPLRSCAQKILRTRHREMKSYSRGTLAGTDPDDLHNMRVAARRLQAVMKLFRDCFPGRVFREESRRMRELIRALGTVRELDVLLAMVEEFSRRQLPERQMAACLLMSRLSVQRTSEYRHLRLILRRTMHPGDLRRFSAFLKSAR